MGTGKPPSQTCPAEAHAPAAAEIYSLISLSYFHSLRSRSDVMCAT